MQAVISPGNVSGSVKIPASKSMMQRACAAALLHKGTTIIHNPGHSNDDNAALTIIQQLGARIISQTKDYIEIHSEGVNPVSNKIDCAESGLSARLFTPIAALSSQAIQINGRGSLLNRPMDVFENIFSQLEVQLEDFKGCVPFTVRGPLQAKHISIDGSVSSQFLSGLLFAFAYSAKETVNIEVHDLKSTPYIDLTIEVLQQFGRYISHDNYKTFYINPANFETKQHIEITIEGDWSSAACWLVAGSIAGDIVIEGLQTNSNQADISLLSLLQSFENIIECNNDSISVKAAPIESFDFDATNCPDLFPLLSILAAASDNECYITGVHRLWHKESNRADSITEMLHQFGIAYSIDEDELFINGRRRLDYGTIDSFNDHRIVMAAAIGALRAKGDVTILGAEAINKSYPDFFKHLISLGASCILTEEQI
ncbi:MAG: 3-phosphoshikimate 1-carboxyvinyltransferase [Bacteroidetes bacterium]|nr:3-phosphoshikimate 1-carboxyvinyltransferase [Bacteroidota bacterium]